MVYVPPKHSLEMKNHCEIFLRWRRLDRRVSENLHTSWYFPQLCRLLSTVTDLLLVLSKLHFSHWSFFIMPPPQHTHTHSSLLYPNALLNKTLATHIFRKLNFFQGSCPFFRNKLSSRAFPELFEDSKIHINPFTAMISMLILLTVCHTFHILHSSSTDFQNFPGAAALF